MHWKRQKVAAGGSGMMSNNRIGKTAFRPTNQGADTIEHILQNGAHDYGTFI